MLSKFQYLLLFFLILGKSSFAQSGLLFSSDKELSSSLINNVFQDKRNFIWVSTEDGLNKYDGVKFTVYRNDKSNIHSLRKNYVRKVFEDSKGRFWVGTINGIQLYDSNTDEFNYVPIYDGKKELSPEIVSITELQNGELLVGVWGNGIARIKADTDKVFIDRSLSDKLNSKYLVDVFQDSKANLWILTSDRGLCLYNLSNGKVRFFEAPKSIGSNQISSMIENSKGDLFVGTLTSGLFIYDKNLEVFTPVKCADDLYCKDLPVKSLFVDSKNQLLVGTDGNGLKKFNYQTGKLENVNIESTFLDLSKAKVHSIMEDNRGNLWFGLFQKGLFLSPTNPQKFKTWSYKSFHNNLIGSSCIMSVLKDREGNLWVGTDNDGLYRVSPQGKSTHYRPDSGENSVSKTIMAIFEDSNGDLWLGSYLKGLAKFNKQSGKCTYFNNISGNLGNNYLSNKVFCIQEDNKKNLWIGTNGAGLYSFNLITKSYIKHFMHVNGDANSLRNDGVYTLLKDESGILWLGTFRGISKLNPDNDKIENPENLNNALPSSIIFSLFEDKNKNLWIGTDDGLCYYDRNKKSSRVFSTKDGLPNNVICGILDDSQGNFWISTHNGISKLEINDFKFFNYYSSDGLQGNEFYKGAHFKSKNGELFFGGTGGISSLIPGDIVTKRQKLEVFLTELTILGVPIHTGQKSGSHIIIDKFISDVNKINLSYDDKMFSLAFSTFNFGNSERIFYRYKLDGLHSQWLNTGLGQSKINFTNLNYGKYTLRVVACENDNESLEKLIELEIYPPWYLSDLAKFLYFILIVSISYIIYRIVNERIQNRHEILRQKHLEEVNESKLQFFINISHEIRTPMTLIMSPLEKLMKDVSNTERSQAYHLMYRNAQRILRLINQLLDIRKIDKKLMVLKMSQINMVDFVKDIYTTFVYQAQKRNLTFDFIHEMEELNAWVDVNNFDKVLVNVLSNAFKFTPDGGEITLSLKQGRDTGRSDALKEFFEIIVSDNGVGIKDDQIERIFERFYQIDQAQKNVNFGTGIGLHLSKNLVELMHGEIFARNRGEGKGSEFIIRIPMGKEHLSDSEISNTDIDEIIIHNKNEFELLNEMEEDSSKTVKSKTKFKILLVDDEEEIRTYLKQNLSELYKVSECENGKIALELLLKERFDLVISDVMMPEMDGITLCRRIKSNVNINSIPVMLLTAKSRDEDKAEGYQYGADAYVSKPFNMDLLKKRIANLIENRERRSPHLSDVPENKELIKQVDLKSSDQILLEKIFKQINENLHRVDFNAQVLADLVGLSRVHLHRKMKELTNQSASDYIRTIRLQQAAELLVSQKYSIAELCYALGFNEQSHFSSKFKEFYGMSPKEYLKNHKNNVT